MIRFRFAVLFLSFFFPFQVFSAEPAPDTATPLLDSDPVVLSHERRDTSDGWIELMETKHFSIAACCIDGRSSEDDGFVRELPVLGLDEKGSIVIGVCDGHHTFEFEGENWVMGKIAEILPGKFVTEAGTVGGSRFLSDACLALDDEIKSGGADLFGSTLNCAVLFPDGRVSVVNVGDSKAALYTFGAGWDCCLPERYSSKTIMHDTYNVAEVERIKLAGGIVRRHPIDGEMRVSDCLNVTRTIGDHAEYNYSPADRSKKLLLAGGDVYEWRFRKRRGEIEFLLLGTDGFWMESDNLFSGRGTDGGYFVYDRLLRGEPLESIVQSLARLAVGTQRKDLRDDITVMIAVPKK